MRLADHRVLTFDVVGTLIDFETGILDCLRPLAGTADDETVLDAFGRAEGEQQRRTPELPFTRMLEPVYERMAAELGLPPGRGAELRASIPRWPAFPDAADALRRLRGRFRLVALTNADDRATAEMSATLGEPFHDAVTAEAAGVSKPDPRVFAYCLGRQSAYGYLLADHVHVAQSQYHDIGVAKRLGYRVCWIERRRGRAGSGATPASGAITTPDLHFGSLDELAGAAGV
ncbi:HAD-IA family hydrolase [Qaidamihabitans albus]|uniref:HAD-IA family hydrolase n=1 Tax=Qaidamihabitans albus TaxID=2795733 RepID=UPI0018F1D79F|nr:HAD-IA family hydrolase [Qaidamihabitans albus]